VDSRVPRFCGIPYENLIKPKSIMLWKRFLKNIFLEIVFNPNLVFLLKRKFWVKRFLGKNFTWLKNWFKECFDKSYFYLICKPCTNCFPHGFYFPKYSKFPFLNQTWISHNLFKKRRTTVLFSIGFRLSKKVWAFKEKTKNRVLSVWLRSFKPWHLKNFICILH